MPNLVVPPPVPKRTEWNLLQRLKFGLAGVIVLDVLFVISLLNSQERHRQLLQTIGIDSAPSIIAANHIKVAIADMDAEVANEMLLKPGQGDTARKVYESRRLEAAEELITAAKNITYKGEFEAIEKLQVGLGQYEIGVQKARDFHERGDPQAIDLYKKASATLTDSLFKAADDLDGVNSSALNAAYDTENADAAHRRGFSSGLGVILLGYLLYLQWDLAGRTRRLVNPGLLAASFVALIMLSYSSRHLNDVKEDLRVAKMDAFDSLDALWHARAIAFAANADESKYLLDGDSTPYENSFFEEAEKSSSFLAKEMHNITFEGESAKAQEAVDRWQAYLNIDKAIRSDKKAKKVEAAIEICVGTKPGQSDFAFAQFDDSLRETIEINQKAFDKSIQSGFAELGTFDRDVEIGAAMIALFCGAGLFVRIREFL